MNAYSWDKQEEPTSFSQFSDLQTNLQRNTHPSLLARQAGSRQHPREPANGNLAPTLSLPTSSGTPRSGGGAARTAQGAGSGPRRKVKPKKGPGGESSTMQRCLEVVEQLLEEEDAEPFAEPVRSASRAAMLHVSHFTCCTMNLRPSQTTQVYCRSLLLWQAITRLATSMYIISQTRNCSVCRMLVTASCSACQPALGGCKSPGIGRLS